MKQQALNDPFGILTEIVPHQAWQEGVIAKIQNQKQSTAGNKLLNARVLLVILVLSANISFAWYRLENKENQTKENLYGQFMATYLINNNLSR